MTTLFKLGLTGGIGSGKSTVAALLAELGAAVIDADAISRQTTAASGAAIDAIRREFGADFIDANGALDRERMRTHAFADPTARARLEAIVHPLVGQETARQTELAMAASRRCVVYDVPLLVESGRWRARVDHVLVIDCTPEVQIERAMRRGGLSRAAVKQIIAAQADRLARLRAADSVICNASLTLEALAQEVRQLAPRFGL